MTFVRDWGAGDIKTSGVQFAEGRRAVGIGVFYRLRLFLGEYFLDVSQGTPWFQGILGKTPQGVAETNLKRRIFSARDVAGITRFRFSTDRNARKLSVSASVITTAGENADVELSEDIV